MSFFGASVLEVLADNRLNDRLIGTVTMMGIKHVPDFDIFGNGLRKDRDTLPQACKDNQNAEMVQRRMRANLQNAHNTHARKWYQEMQREVERKLSKLHEHESAHNGDGQREKEEGQDLRKTASMAHTEAVEKGTDPSKQKKNLQARGGQRDERTGRGADSEGKSAEDVDMMAAEATTARTKQDQATGGKQKNADNGGDPKGSETKNQF